MVDVTRGRTDPAVLIWPALGVVSFLLDTRMPAQRHEISQPAFAMLTALLGIWIFWTHGGRRITGAGLFSLAATMFGGYAGLYWYVQPGMVSTELYQATAACFWSLWAMWAIFWRDRPAPENAPEPPDPAATSWLIITGLALNAAATVAWLTGFRVGQTLVQEVAFSGMALFAAGIILHRGGRLRLFRRLALAAAAVFIFSETTFSGYGRLILVSLALIPVVLTSWRLGTRMTKGLVLTVTVPALMYLTQMREQFGLAKYGTELNGIGSVVSPLHDFSRLISTHTYEPGHGETFWAAAVVWIPRSLWEDKPVGFGLEITRILEPELLSIGQSMAALTQGEWYFNFGWWGLVPMVLAIGLLVRCIDVWAVRVSTAGLTSRRALLTLTIALLLIADLPNLMWVGTFGYLSRTVLRVAVILALFAFAKRAGSASKAPRGREPDLSSSGRPSGR